jgi:hypothetical protein
VNELVVFGEPAAVMIVHAGTETPYQTRENQMFVRRGANNYQPTPGELTTLMNPRASGALFGQSFV